MSVYIMEIAYMINDFETICRRLHAVNKSNNCQNNNYLCAKHEVKKYVGEDRNKLLKLKAEATGINFFDYLAVYLAAISMLVSICAIACTIFNSALTAELAKIILCYKGMFTIGILILVIVFIILIDRYWCIQTWRGYVCIAIEELEKEL